IIGEASKTGFKLPFGGFLHRQELTQLGYFRSELAKRRILAGYLPRQQELGDDEHRQQKGDDEQKLRHRIDEARPVGRVIGAAAAGERSCHALFLILDDGALTEAAARPIALAGRLEHQTLQLTLLVLLRLCPLTD